MHPFVLQPFVKIICLCVILLTIPYMGLAEETGEITEDDEFTWETRVRGYIPLSTTMSVAGFDKDSPTKQEFNLTMIFPINSIIGIGGGLNYTRVSVAKEVSRREFSSNSFSAIDLKAEAEMVAYTGEVSFDYKGFTLGKKRVVILNVGLEFPLSGRGTLDYNLREIGTFGQTTTPTTTDTGTDTTDTDSTDDTDATGTGTTTTPTSSNIPRVTDQSKEVSSVSGFGIFASAGLTFGKWELFMYYRSRNFQYDMDVPLVNGSTETVVLSITEFGTGLGFVF